MSGYSEFCKCVHCCYALLVEAVNESDLQFLNILVILAKLYFSSLYVVCTPNFVEGQLNMQACNLFNQTFTVIKCNKCIFDAMLFMRKCFLYNSVMNTDLHG